MFFSLLTVLIAFKCSVFGSAAGVEFITSIPCKDCDETLNWWNLRSIFNGKLLLAVDDGFHGTEPWVTDGTKEGTILLKDINVGADGSRPFFEFFERGDVVFKDRLYFTATGLVGEELYATDGTPENTELLRDILPDGSSRPKGAAIIDNTMFFSARDAVHGRELWASNGTAASTVLWKDFLPGSESSDVELFAIVSEPTKRLIYRLEDANGLDQLWSWDGTNFDLLAQLEESRSSTSIVRSRDEAKRFFFFSYGSPRPADTWVTDGTPRGTAILVPNSTLAFSFATYSVENRETVLFLKDGRVFLTDGTPDGTDQVRHEYDLSGVYSVAALKDDSGFLFTSANSVFSLVGGNIVALQEFDNTTSPWLVASYEKGVLFDTWTRSPSISEEVGRYQLWITDGTPSGLRKLGSRIVVGNEFVGAQLLNDNSTMIVLTGKVTYLDDEQSLIASRSVLLWMVDIEKESVQFKSMIDLKVDSGSERPETVMLNDTTLLLLSSRVDTIDMWKIDLAHFGIVSSPSGGSNAMMFTGWLLPIVMVCTLQLS